MSWREVGLGSKKYRCLAVFTLPSLTFMVTLGSLVLPVMQVRESDPVTHPRSRNSGGVWDPYSASLGPVLFINCSVSTTAGPDVWMRAGEGEEELGDGCLTRELGADGASHWNLGHGSLNRTGRWWEPEVIPLAMGSGLLNIEFWGLKYLR